MQTREAASLCSGGKTAASTLPWRHSVRRAACTRDASRRCRGRSHWTALPNGGWTIKMLILLCDTHARAHSHTWKKKKIPPFRSNLCHVRCVELYYSSADDRYVKYKYLLRHKLCKFRLMKLLKTTRIRLYFSRLYSRSRRIDELNFTIANVLVLKYKIARYS